MSHPHPAPFGGPHPQHAPPRVSPATHPVDMVLSVFGWVVLAAGSGFLLVFSPFALLVGLACGPSHTDPPICTESGTTAYVVTVLACLAALVLACTVSLVGLIVALARGARAWPWVLAGHVVAALATLAVVVVAAVVTS
ncbi:hypothetical protein [Aeromicrobium sp. Leaf350]|uniref:hypothetical protein n=1 Tax=Aeromicrobium sp. Leaf350 TaxID=2876565 RepID=UPI001E2E8A3B|nr:hypothetical protein [Aeromicrobium sp. Leaf350]